MIPLSPIPLRTPTGVWTVAVVLKKIHRFWQYSIRVKPYTNPDNFFGLGLGYALNFVLGQNRLLKLPALPFLVGTRLLDLFEQEDAFRNTCQRWKEAFKGTQPIVILRGQKAAYGSFCPRCLVRIQRVALATLGISREGFVLLMRMMDVLELITFDSQQLEKLVDLGVREGALNIPRCLNALNRNKEVLIQRLNGKKEALDGVMKRLGAKKTRGEAVVAVAKNAIEHLHEWTQAYEAIAQAVGGLFKGQKKATVIVPPRQVITLPFR